MLKLNGNLTYAQAQAALSSIGPVSHMFYRLGMGSNVIAIEGDFADRHFAFGFNIDPAVAEATLLTDYPMAINAPIGVSI